MILQKLQESHVSSSNVAPSIKKGRPRSCSEAQMRQYLDAREEALVLEQMRTAFYTDTTNSPLTRRSSIKSDSTSVVAPNSEPPFAFYGAPPPLARGGAPRAKIIVTRHGQADGCLWRYLCFCCTKYTFHLWLSRIFLILALAIFVYLWMFEPQQLSPAYVKARSHTLFNQSSFKKQLLIMLM